MIHWYSVLFGFFLGVLITVVVGTLLMHWAFGWGYPYDDEDV